MLNFLSVSLCANLMLSSSLPPLFYPPTDVTQQADCRRVEAPWTWSQYRKTETGRHRVDYMCFTLMQAGVKLFKSIWSFLYLFYVPLSFLSTSCSLLLRNITPISNIPSTVGNVIIILSKEETRHLSVLTSLSRPLGLDKAHWGCVFNQLWSVSIKVLVDKLNLLPQKDKLLFFLKA